MKLLVFSDLHYPSRWSVNITKFLSSKIFDKLIFCWDFVSYEIYLEIISIYWDKLISVYGNMDDYRIKQEVPEQIITNINWNNMLIFHSFSIYPRWDNKQLLDVAIKNNCNIVLYGHTHIQKITKYTNWQFSILKKIDHIDPNSIYLINPWSILEWKHLEFQL